MTDVAIVSGGAGGLGRACVDVLGESGYAVAVFDNDPQRLEVVGADLAERGWPHVTSTVDVTDEASVVEAHDRVKAELGEVSVLLNAAGIARSTRFQDITREEWDEVIAVSVTGTFLLVQACLPSMRRERRGRIVNFSSTAGKSVSMLAGAHYTSAKAAVLGLTRALAKELAPDGITVNAICPGLFETAMARALVPDGALEQFAPLIPVGRLGRPSEIGALIGFLISDHASFITGAAIDINGGELLV